MINPPSCQANMLQTEQSPQPLLSYILMLPPSNAVIHGLLWLGCEIPLEARMLENLVQSWERSL